MHMSLPHPHIELCVDCPIQRRAFCARCDSDEFRLLEDIKYYRSYQAGQSVMWSGDRMNFVASVVSGVATLTRTIEDGRRQVVGLLLPSDFLLGRPGQELSLYDVTAATDLVMCCFRKTPFEDIIATTPHVSQRLLEMALNELDAAREWMLLLGRKTAREKIASLILNFARREAAPPANTKREPLVIDLLLTREMMADYLGMTLETVSRQLSGLGRDGAIRVEGNRHVSVLRLDLLSEAAGEDSDGGYLS